MVVAKVAILAAVMAKVMAEMLAAVANRVARRLCSSRGTIRLEARSSQECRRAHSQVDNRSLATCGNPSHFRPCILHRRCTESIGRVAVRVVVVMARVVTAAVAAAAVCTEVVVEAAATVASAGELVGSAAAVMVVAATTVGGRLAGKVAYCHAPIDRHNLCNLAQVGKI